MKDYYIEDKIKITKKRVEGIRAKRDCHTRR